MFLFILFFKSISVIQQIMSNLQEKKFIQQPNWYVCVCVLTHRNLSGQNYLFLTANKKIFYYYLFMQFRQ